MTSLDDLADPLARRSLRIRAPLSRDRCLRLRRKLGPYDLVAAIPSKIHRRRVLAAAAIGCRPGTALRQAVGRPRNLGEVIDPPSR